MTHAERERVLRGLAAFGPLSCNDLAESIGLEYHVTYVCIANMRRHGLIDKTGPASYALTPEGRKYLAVSGLVQEKPLDKQQYLF